MSERRLIDTNLIIRHLVQDNEKQAKAAEKLFIACDRGEITVLLLPAVLAECVFVLESFYRQPRADISAALEKLITSPGIELPGVEVQVDALQRYAHSNAHFVDCLLAATAAAQRIPVATFDRDFRRFPDLEVRID